MTSQVWKRVLATVLLIVGTSATAAATLRNVPSVYPTIQAAIDASVDGDSVMIAPGTYTGVGNRDLDPGTKTISIIGEGGADQTILNCRVQARGLWVHGGQSEDFLFSGITVVNGFASRGAGFYIETGSKVAIVDCVFDSCSTSGGAIHEGQGVLRGTRISNSFPENGARGTLSWISGVIEECEIVDNLSVGLSISYNVTDIVNLRVSDTLIARNTFGVFLSTELVFLTMENCAILGNDNGSLWLQSLSWFNPIMISETTITPSSMYVENAQVTFERAILDPACGRIEVGQGAQVLLNCCSYDPAGPIGDGELIEIGEQSYDSPEFCDGLDCGFGPSADLRVSDTSPCLPENSPCGELIGAYGIGCGVAGVGELATTDTPTGITFTSPIPARNQIRFQIPPSDGITILEIHDTRGRILARREIEDNNGQEIEWRFTDSTGGKVPAGIYFLSVADRSGKLATAKFVWMAE